MTKSPTTVQFSFRFPSRLVLFLTSIVLGLPLSQGWAQVPPRLTSKFYPDFSDTADALLRNAASHAKDGQWAEAIDIYQRVIQQYGDKVARLPKDDPAGDPTGDSFLYVDLRQFCQRRLAALPADALAIYRRRVDTQAERWYKQGAAERDRTLLRRIVEQAYCSSWGDDALDLLGDLAFQEGRFDESLALYRQLVPDGDANRGGLVYPDPSVELARVAAKKLLSRAALGENPPGPADVAAYAKAYPDARGNLAGRTGLYSEIVAAAIKSDHLTPPAQPDGRWPTFAGSPTRTRVVPGPIDVGSLQWRVELPVPSHSEGGGRTPFVRGMRGMPFQPPQVSPDRLLAYHPIVIGDQVLVCDENRILAYNLNDRPSGPTTVVEPAWKREEGSKGMAPAMRTIPRVPRYTLTAVGDRIYARMGASTLPVLGGMGPRNREEKSFLIAVDRSTEGKLIWNKPAPDVELPKRHAEAQNRPAGFEGTPVADAHNVYVAMTDRGEQTATYVACLDADTGNKRWVRYLGAASPEIDNNMGMAFGMAPTLIPSDFGHRLLTLDGTSLYYQTNLGAVVALDTENGAIRWVATYPRQDRVGGADGRDRDLNPAIVHDGLVIVAPDDATSLFAFDAATGRLVWKSPAFADDVKLAHVLGVAKGHVVATGNRVVLLDVKNGNMVHSWPDGGGPPVTGFGRGLLAGDRIYWPTQREIHILDQSTGLPTDPPIQLKEAFGTEGGNLCVGDGYLIVAQSNALVVFCQNSRLIQRYKEEIARNPDQATGYYRLAQAAEATGQEALALESLTKALHRARPSENIDGVPLVEAAKVQEYRLLMKLAAQAKGAKNLAEAARYFTEAAEAAQTDRDRLHARLTLASIQLDRGQPKDAVRILHALLNDDRLASTNVAAEDGHRTIRANLLITDRLAGIVRTQGRAVYEEFDRKAQSLLEQGRKQKDPRLLEEVARGYPLAEVLPDALLALGALQESKARPAEASHAYKRLLALEPENSYRARALWGLARAYEGQRLWVSARDAYLQAQSRFGDVVLNELGTDATVKRLVAERLSRAPFDRMADDDAEPNLPVPLSRLWSRTFEGPQHPLSAVGIPPASASSRIFLVQGSTLRPVEPATGVAAWTAELGSAPVWAGYLADKVLAATESRVVALSLDKGEIEWQYPPNAQAPSARGPNPFAKSTAENNESQEPSLGRFHSFKIVGERLYIQCGDQNGDHKLLALDGDSGLVDWTYRPAGGTINPNLLIGPNQIVFQVRRPNSIQVLDTSTGRRRAEWPQTDEEAWPRPPLPIDDERVALVSDVLTVALFDTVRGTNSWVFRESDKLPTHGPPRLFGDSERLLMLHNGNELIRLDLSTGVRLWSLPLGIEDLSERPDALVRDSQRVYWTSDRMIRGASLADGQTVWSAPLLGPESGWSLALTEQCILVYPRASRSLENESQGTSLVLRRRENGAFVQRLWFREGLGHTPARHPARAVPNEIAIRLSPRGALLASQGGIWALGAGKKPTTDMRTPGP